MYVKTGMQNEKCKMKNAKCKSDSGQHIAFCIEHFALNIYHPRRGLSLTEVLIAMGILTLGLLGVASIFPVAGFYMHKAELEDRGHAFARSVMNDLVASGMLNPGAWHMMIPLAGPAPQGALLPSDGKYAPSSNQVRGTYGRPFAVTLAEALTKPAASEDPTFIGKQFGGAYVIDPIGISTMAFPNPTFGSQDWNIASAAFPASVNGFIPPQFYTGWQPWGTMWPVRRVTFRQPNTGWQMDSMTAQHYFEGNDDLVTELPDRDDRPATQNWDTIVDGMGNSIPIARQWVGDYSWIVTVVPTTNAARDGMARSPESHAYDVSVVVFYKRPLPPDAVSLATTTNGRNDFLANVGRNERAVTARVLSTGLNGGELLLERLSSESTNPFDDLRTGQWIMLCGPHPNSNVTSTSPPRGEPRFALNWYQVVTIDREGVGIQPALKPTQRLVTVRGPQWPWQPAANGPWDSNNVSNNLCVAICRGAVAVHSKTLRLEDPRSSEVAFGSGGDPRQIPPKWELK